MISCTWWAEVHTETMFFSVVGAKQKRFVSLHMGATAGALATGARWPVEIYYAVLRKAHALLGGGGDLHVTTPSGTDITFRNITLTPDDGPLVPGGWRPFPHGGANFIPRTPRACSWSTTRRSLACRRSPAVCTSRTTS